MALRTRELIPTRLERSELYVPASRWSMIQKAATSVADAVCLDLEDSVPGMEKPAARLNCIRALRELDFGSRTRVLRINSLDTPFAYTDLIEVLEAAGSQLDLVMLPKVTGVRDVLFVDTLLTQIEAKCGLGRRIGIEALIETAAGFLYAREIAECSARLESLIFGPGDFAASMQMPAANIGEGDAHDAGYPGHRWHSVMHMIVAAARAKGLRCLDGVFASYRDADGFERSCKLARVMGFDGKQCIHPDQLAIANSVFTPPDDEVERAEQVLRAYGQAVAEGRGAISLDGKMVDAANIRMAQFVVEKHRLSQTTGQK